MESFLRPMDAVIVPKGLLRPGDIEVLPVVTQRVVKSFFSSAGEDTIAAWKKGLLEGLSAISEAVPSDILSQYRSSVWTKWMAGCLQDFPSSLATAHTVRTGAPSPTAERREERTSVAAEDPPVSGAVAALATETPPASGEAARLASEEPG